MRISIISFTEKGMVLSERIAEQITGQNVKQSMKQTIKPQVRLFTRWSGSASPIYAEQSLEAWTRAQMAEKNALLFIGACGIAVRAIAPSLTDKLHDSPVLVMDELGTYVIPILSGHMGGANALAGELAELTGAVPVITTATDLNHAFAADLFAKRNGLSILNKEGIAKVSAKVLAGETVAMTVEAGHISGPDEVPRGLRLVPYPPNKPVDIAVTSKPEELEVTAALWLKPREYVLGMGCRKKKEAEKIEAFALKHLREAGISTEQLLMLTSIDKKEKEPGFLALSRRHNIPFVTYTAEQLQEAEGTFRTSDFVKMQVGVDNVCERSALLACGPGGKLMMEKRAEDGMTLAIARRKWSVKFDET